MLGPSSQMRQRVQRTSGDLKVHLVLHLTKDADPGRREVILDPVFRCFCLECGLFSCSVCHLCGHLHAHLPSCPFCFSVRARLLYASSYNSIYI